MKHTRAPAYSNAIPTPPLFPMTFPKPHDTASSLTSRTIGDSSRRTNTSIWIQSPGFKDTPARCINSSSPPSAANTLVTNPSSTGAS